MVCGNLHKLLRTHKSLGRLINNWFSKENDKENGSSNSKSKHEVLMHELGLLTVTSIKVPGTLI